MKPLELYKCITCGYVGNAQQWDAMNSNSWLSIRTESVRKAFFQICPRCKTRVDFDKPEHGQVIKSFKNNTEAAGLLKKI